MGTKRKRWERQLLETLKAAILTDGRLDGSEGVLGEGVAGLVLKTSKLAPVLLSGGELQDDWPSGSPASEARLELDRLEQLSLAARLHMAARLHRSRALLRSGILKALPDTEAKKRAKAIKVELGAFPRIPARLIVEALAWANGYFDTVNLTTPSPTSAGESQKARAGLSIHGARIDGDLKLFNAILPFPLRLTGCVINGSIIADHCQLASLDLSGSAIHGISANFLRLQGSLRLRRTFSIGPVDLGAANIGGVLDISDAVVSPFIQPPAGTGFAGERGAINLSLATIDNEFRAIRARIYGGLNMRGATVRRSMYLDRALICSPIAAVAKMAFDYILERRLSLVGHPELEEFRDRLSTDGAIALAICPEPGPRTHSLSTVTKAALRKAEVHGVPYITQNPNSQRLLFRLLAESMRARTCAIRADSLDVNGSIFARGLVTMGRLRIKYGRIRGGFHLEGSRLRSPRESFAAMRALRAFPEPIVDRFRALAEKTKVLALRHEKGEGESYALDIRETIVEGSVSLTPSNRPKPLDGEAAVVGGAVVASQAQIGSGFNLAGVVFEQVDPHRPDHRATLDIEHTAIGCDLSLIRTRGLRGINGSYAKIAGSVFLCRPEQDEGEKTEPEMIMITDHCEADGWVEFRSASVGGDLWLLFHRERGPDILLRHAAIGGALNIYPARIDWAAPTRDVPKASPAAIDARIEASEFHALVETARLARRAVRTLQRQGATAARPKTIDLRSCRATVFRHPPRAWPSQNGLRIGAFSYEIAGKMGPLSALTEGLLPSKPDAARDATTLVRERAASISIGSLCLLACLGLAAAALLEGFDGARNWRPVHWLQATHWIASDNAHPIVWALKDWRPVAWLDRVGLINVGLLCALILATLALRHASKHLRPTREQTKPMGAHWLRLQPHLPNPFRRLRGYTPTDPYLTAAKALRNDGKMRSADWIELERARARTRLLSKRHHLLGRSALRMVDLVSQYGFNLGRTVIIVAAVILVSACVFELAETQYRIEYPGKKHDPSFSSVKVATATIVPFMKEADDKRWPKSDQIQRKPTIWENYMLLVEILAWGLKALGILLVGLIAAGVAARTESFLSRIQS